MKKNAVPVRRDDLLVQKVVEEMIVYDPASHRAHSLNRPAALVFEKLDGKTDLAAVTRHVGKTVGHSHQKEIVASALNELAAADLLQPGAALPRRSVLRGLAAGLLPVVVSIAVPTAANAQSCVLVGDDCSGGVPCCPGSTCDGICYSLG